MRRELTFPGRTRRPAAAIASAAALAAAVLLSGCGGDENEPTASAGAEAGAEAGSAGDASDDGGSASAEVPQECVDAGIPSMGPASLDDVADLPDGWPDAPDGAVLCLTSSTARDAQETLQYASALPPEEVYAAYESALPSTSREKDGIGQQVLAGEAGSVVYRIKARDGAYTITFAAG